MMQRKENNSEKESSNKIEAKTGGHFFLQILQKMGAQFVFGTTGAGLAEVQDAMVVVKPPKFVQGLHEFTSVSAACGYALVSGETGVALIDRIVGTQNSIGALYGAYQNFAPIVVFASRDVPGIPLEPDAAHYHSEMLQMTKPWTKWNAEIQSLATLSQTIEKTFFVVNSEPKGPAFVTLRRDIMSQPFTQGTFSNSAMPYLSAKIPEDSVLEELATDILSHSNPSVVVSHLGRNPKSVESLIRFAHSCGLGVIERRYFMNYPLLDPLHVNFLHIRRPRLTDLLGDSDLAILLETGLSGNNKLPEKLDVIDLASDPLHLQDLPLGGDNGSYVFQASIRTSCDVGPSIDKLAAVVEKKADSRDRAIIAERIERLTENHSKLVKDRRERARRSFESGALDAWSIGYAVNKHVSDGEFIWVNGTPSLTYTQMIETIELSKPGTYYSNPSTHVGVTVGMGYGAALGDRSYIAMNTRKDFSNGVLSPVSRVVLCSIGDGEAVFGNIDSALWTCKHYGIGVVYLIFNNSCWGIDAAFIEHSSQHWAKASRDFEFVDIDRPTINFTKLAEAFSVSAFSAGDAQSFDSELGKAISVARKGEPALVELRLEKYTGREQSSVL